MSLHILVLSLIWKICKQGSCTGHQWFSGTVPTDCKILDLRLALWINPEGKPVGLEIKGSCMKAFPKSETHLGTNGKGPNICRERPIQRIRKYLNPDDLKVIFGSEFYSSFLFLA